MSREGVQSLFYASMAIILPILAVFDAILAGNLHYTACGKRYGHKLSGQSELNIGAPIETASWKSQPDAKPVPNYDYTEYKERMDIGYRYYDLTAASGKFCPKNFLYLSPESFGFDS